ncbi:FapA family protein [bacterium]|nr:FapA family protein [bacterium]
MIDEEKNSTDSPDGGENQSPISEEELRELAKNLYSEEDEGDVVRFTSDVIISEDGYSAHITIDAPKGSPISVYRIHDVLAREKIIFGIKKEALTLLASKDVPRGVPVLIAEGIRPLESMDGEVEYLFQRDPKPKVRVDATGRVDYHEVGIIQTVKAEQLIAIRKPPTGGRSGKRVTGEEIDTSTGKEIFLRAGRNTYFKPGDNNRLYAKSKGCVRAGRGGEIEVNKIYTIDGDIDLRTGNIYFDGSVHIRGSVRAGFRVVTTEDLEISGVVEDAALHVGGNLMIRRGAVGSGKRMIQVVGDTHIRFIENQKLVCNGDVYIAEAALNCEVISGGSIILEHGKGVIIGGHIRAKGNIIARTIGNVHYTRTSVYAGYRPQMDDWISEISEALDSEIETRQKIQEAINIMVKNKYTQEGESEGTDYYLMTLQKISSEMDVWVDQARARYDELFEKRNEETKFCSIRVIRKVYPGVYAHIGEGRRKVDEEVSGTLFVYRNGRVIMEESSRSRLNF